MTARARIAGLLGLAVGLGLCLAPPVAHAQAPQAPQGTGRISGTVTRKDTGVPVPNAMIRWVRWEGGLGQQGVVRVGPDGKFSLTGLRPGSFQLIADAEGLVRTDYGQTVYGQPGRRIELADGGVFLEADIAMLPTSAVEGRILDEFGDPVPGLTVQVAQVQFVAGKRRLLPLGGSQPPPTDDLGQFRVAGLPPGDYYVLALSGPFATALSSTAGFAVTYYPGTALPTEARAVRVAPGQDATGLTFPMTPAPLSALSGVAVDETGQPVPNANLMLVQLAGGDIRAMVVARGLSAPDGTFAFRNVAAGTYVLQGFGRPVGGGNLGKAPFGYLPVTAAGDRADLRLTIAPGAVARGQFVFEGDNTGLVPQRVSMGFTTTDFISSPVAGGPPNAETRADWTFEVQNQTGFRIGRPNVGAPGWMLKSIVLDGNDVTDAPIDFTRGDVNGLIVTLTNREGVVGGTVTTDDGSPAGDFTVVVFAEDPSAWPFPSRRVGAARPMAGPAGRFRLGGLPAGRYLVAAVPSVNGTEYQDPEFLQGLRAGATSVTVTEGATADVRLTIIKR